MRANIIQTLIIAFVLIAGWSLFTVYQDLSKKGNGNFSSEMIISGGKQYLPISPAGNSYNGRSLPSYKASKRSSGNYSGRNQNQSVRGGNLFGSSVFGIPESTQGGNSSGYAGDYSSGSFGSQGGRRNTQVSSNSYPVLAVAPFSKRMKIETQRDLALNDKPAETTTGMLSDGTRYKVFGGGEGGVLEDGGGTEDLGAYNDSEVVPVGDGLIFLLLMAGIYIIYQFFNRNSVKTTIVKK